MKKSLTIVLVAIIAVLAAYIVFREHQFAKWKSGEGAHKPEVTVRKTKEYDALKKREEIYRRAAEKDKSAVTQLLTQLKDDSPMVRLAAARWRSHFRMSASGASAAMNISRLTAHPIPCYGGIYRICNSFLAHA